MVDGEADAEIDLALRRLSRDGDVQIRWERYHLISDTMQGHLPAMRFDTAFRRAHPPSHRPPNRRRNRRFDHCRPGINRSPAFGWPPR
jgi:hypothetical protein